MLGMAPALAERAKRLFSRRGNEAPPPAAAEAVSAIEVRMHTVEKRVVELREEMAASFEVVSAITDQHSELVRTVDELLARTRRLQRICIASAIGLGVALLAMAVLAFGR